MRLNKKASMVLVYMILGLVIILIAIPFLKFINKTSDASMAKEWDIKPQDDFKPYDYKSQTNPDDQIALDSTNALVSAINKLALSKPLPQSKDNFQEFDCNKKEVNDVFFGDTFVKCGPNNCLICNFTLPQKVTNAEEYIAGYGDPKYVLYYESFPIGEEEGWNIDKSNIALGTIIIGDGIFAVLGAKTEAIKKLGKAFIEARAASKVVESSSVSILKSFVKEGITSGVNAVNVNLLKKAMSSNPKLIRRLALQKDITPVYVIADDIIKSNKEGFDLLYKEVENNPVLKEEFQTFANEFSSRLLLQNSKPVLIDRTTKGLVALWVASVAYDTDLRNQKFEPIGINNIGLKIESSPTAISGSSQINNLNDYASRYYLSLAKPDTLGIFSNAPQRFYLVSPCKTDLLVSKKACECEAPSDNGFTYVDQNTIISNTKLDSTLDKKIVVNWVLLSDTSITKANNDISKGIKYCQKPESHYLSKATPSYKADCMTIEPKNMEGFCYSKGDSSKIIGYAGLGVNLVVSVGLSTIFPPAAIMMPWITQVGIDVVTTLLTNWAQTATKWP